MIERVGGIGMSWEERGKGAAVLFVHGFPHDHSLWRAQVAALGGHARCIAPDLRGFGESEVAPPWSVDQWADDIAALLDARGVERATVCGLSMGGYIAFALWRRHRERVRALVLADTRAGPDDEAAKAKRREMIALAREGGAAAVAERMMPGMIGKTTRERAPERAAQVRAMLERAPVEGIVGALEAMMARPDSTPTLATIDVPTLVIVGEEDALTPPADARAMHERIAGSRLETIAGAGHASAFERPAAFSHVLGEFIAGLEARGAA
jgi:3-oxoadipate enol-lactonase